MFAPPGRPRSDHRCRGGGPRGSCMREPRRPMCDRRSRACTCPRRSLGVHIAGIRTHRSARSTPFRAGMGRTCRHRPPPAARQGIGTPERAQRTRAPWGKLCIARSLRAARSADRCRLRRPGTRLFPWDTGRTRRPSRWGHGPDKRTARVAWTTVGLAGTPCSHRRRPRACADRRCNPWPRRRRPCLCWGNAVAPARWAPQGKRRAARPKARDRALRGSSIGRATWARA